jgi:hypothetical protein
MAIHQKFSFGGGTIEMHAGAPGEQFIGVNPAGPSDSATPPPANVIIPGGKQTNVTVGSTKIVTPA